MVADKGRGIQNIEHFADVTYGCFKDFDDYATDTYAKEGKEGRRGCRPRSHLAGDYF